MLKKQKRITRKTFIHDPLQRMMLSGRFITMTHYKDSSSSTSRFTVTISKKVSKKATERNYLKRIVYEVVKTNTKAFDVKFSGDTIFSFKNTPTIPSFNEVQTDILFFLARK